MATYTYSLSADFGNDICLKTLTDEVTSAGSGITTGLTHISIGLSASEDNVSIVFDSALSGAEQTALDNIVAAHSGTPCPSTLEDFITWVQNASGATLAQSMAYTDTQIAGVSGGSGIFGSEFQQNTSESDSSTTSESYQQKLRLTTSSLPEGTYYIQWYFEFWADGHPGFGRVQINDSETIAEAAHDSSLGDLSDGYTPVTGFIIKTSFSGVKNIDIDYRSANSSYTFYIRRARLLVWRIS